MTLLAEIQTHCSQALIDSRDDGAIAAAVNAARPGKVGKVDRAYFAMWAASTGMRSKIEDQATDLASPLRDAALACRDVIQGAAESIDFALTDNVTMLSAWVALGHLTQTNADKLLALATHDDHCTIDQVSAALNGA
ncbi:MAG: hypothetical protein Q7U28_08205 [Aquabacterium sp.]|nr:hypothetical protein [Aquabacterium sp.]